MGHSGSQCGASSMVQLHQVTVHLKVQGDLMLSSYEHDPVWSQALVREETTCVGRYGPTHNLL